MPLDQAIAYALTVERPAPADAPPDAPAGSPSLPLSQREREVAVLIARGLTNQQIAEELFLSVDAVKAHLRALFGAFGVEDLPQNQKRSVLAMRAMQLGLDR